MPHFLARFVEVVKRGLIVDKIGVVRLPSKTIFFLLLSDTLPDGAVIAHVAVFVERIFGPLHHTDGLTFVPYVDCSFECFARDILASDQVSVVTIPPPWSFVFIWPMNAHTAQIEEVWHRQNFFMGHSSSA